MLLITGATGYVGSHFLKAIPEHLRRDCLSPSRQEMDLTNADSVKLYFKTHSIDRVLHLAAALDNTDSVSLLNSNISGLYYLLQESKTAEIQHFVFASSNTVYGTRKAFSIPESQSDCPDADNHYAVTKYYGELMVKDVLGGFRHTIVRIGDIYGPNQKTGALIKAVVKNIVHAEPQRLYGQGDRTRDYIYIDDVVSGLQYILEKKLTGVYNLATGVGTDVREIIHIAETLSDCKSPTIPVPTEHEDHSKIVLDITKLKNAGWEAEVSFKEGLGRIVEETRR